MTNLDRISISVISIALLLLTLWVQQLDNSMQMIHERLSVIECIITDGELSYCKGL